MQKGKGKGKDQFLVHMSRWCLPERGESTPLGEVSTDSAVCRCCLAHNSVSQGSCDPAQTGAAAQAKAAPMPASQRGWIYCPPAVVAGGVPSGISSEHGWAFATQVAGGYLLNDTNKTQKQSRLMSVIPSDHLNAHILGEEQPPTHPFSHTLSKYGEQCGRCTLEKKVRIDLGAGSAKQKPQSQMSQSPGTAGKSRRDAV